jgi:hypothetical protein
MANANELEDKLVEIEDVLRRAATWLNGATSRLAGDKAKEIRDLLPHRFGAQQQPQQAQPQAPVDAATVSAPSQPFPTSLPSQDAQSGLQAGNEGAPGTA